MERVREEQRKRGSEQELPFTRSRADQADAVLPAAMSALIEERKLLVKLALSLALNVALVTTLVLVLII